MKLRRCLRKEPAREGELRLIEIAGFDLTPCGGTHANATGEVGVITVRGWERAKGLIRIQFLAGLRVANDYRKANRAATETAALFSAARGDSPTLVGKLIDESKKLARRVRELDQIACRVEAEEMIKAALAGRGPTPGSPDGQPGWGGTVREGSTTIIAKIFEDRDSDSLKQLALALINHPNVIALLASRDGETARLVFARSSGATGDMNALMRKACEMIDGRGGGKPDVAQGGGKNIAALDDALQTALRSLTQS